MSDWKTPADMGWDPRNAVVAKIVRANAERRGVELSKQEVDALFDEMARAGKEIAKQREAMERCLKYAVASAAAIRETIDEGSE